MTKSQKIKKKNGAAMSETKKTSKTQDRDCSVALLDQVKFSWRKDQKVNSWKAQVEEFKKFQNSKGRKDAFVRRRRSRKYNWVEEVEK